jgi:hypothetical protein
LSGNYAYILSDEGLEIIDITNPSNPVHAGMTTYVSTESIGDNNGVYVSGNYAYVAGDGSIPEGEEFPDEGLFIFDITQSSNPKLVAEITKSDFNGFTWAFGVFAQSGRAYVLSGFWDNLTVVNVFQKSVYRFWSDKYNGHFYTASKEEKDNIINNDSNWTYEGVVYNVFNDYSPNVKPVYRFWSEKYKHHFYTISEGEKQTVIDNYDDDIWKYEGVAYYAYQGEELDSKPVYRFWSDNFKHHFYTTSDTEAKNDPNWRYEGIAYYAYTSPQTNALPVYRFWSDKFNGHFYTQSESEKDYIIANDPNWRFEGTAWYFPL